MDQQIDLIVHWMRVGFIHGVMNTDNIAAKPLITGRAFMDAYDPDTVFSSIDQMGRYAYKKPTHDCTMELKSDWRKPYCH